MQVNPWSNVGYKYSLGGVSGPSTVNAQASASEEKAEEEQGIGNGVQPKEAETENVQNEESQADNSIKGLAASFQHLQRSNVVHGMRQTAMLHGILQRTYSYVLKLDSKTESQELINQVDALHKETYPDDDKSKRRQKLSKLVRCVFYGADDRLVNTYKTLLEFALKSKVDASEFSAFIEKHGGIQKAKLQAHANNQGNVLLTVDQMIEAFEKDCAALTYGDFSQDIPTRNFKEVKVGDTVVFLATKTSTQTFAIKSLIDSEGVVKAAKVCGYKQLHPKPKKTASSKAAGIKKTAIADAAS